jgi:sortase (surface protein transpeptidase)
VVTLRKASPTPARKPLVDQPLSVRLDNAAWRDTTPDERLTLVTCWPAWDNSQRLIIVAYPLPR